MTKCRISQQLYRFIGIQKYFRLNAKILSNRVAYTVRTWRKFFINILVKFCCSHARFKNKLNHRMIKLYVFHFHFILFAHFNSTSIQDVFRDTLISNQNKGFTNQIHSTQYRDQQSLKGQNFRRYVDAGNRSTQSIIFVISRSVMV